MTSKNIEEKDLFDLPELIHYKLNDNQLQDDNDNPILPAQLPTTVHQISNVVISCNQANTPAFDIKLAIDAAPGCGGITWPAGCVLANYLCSRKSLHGLTVVELGSGTGLVGIAAGLLQAKSVWVTDQEPLLDLMQTNVALNGLDSNVKVARLDWGSHLPSTIPHKPDLVIAADCVYFEPAFELLVSTLTALATWPKTEILFCYKKRRKADRRFFTLLKKEFTWKAITDDPCREDYARKGIFLYSLLKKNLIRTL